MAIDTKPNLKDGKFEQAQGDTLHLSGSTHVYGQFLIQSGGTFSILSNGGTGKVLTSGSGGTATWETSTGGGTITGATNGLSVSGKNIGLGGILNGNTIINLDSYTLDFSGGTGNILITGGLELLTTPTNGTSTDKILVWNSSDKLIKKVSYFSGNSYTKTEIDHFTGTTLPNNYYNKTQINAYTGKTYNLSSPSVCPVGGVCVNTVLTGKTAFQLIEAILVPEICGTITAPSTAISISPTTNLYEIGCSISTLNVTGTFNRGCINPQGCSTSDKRSGCANCYVFTGCQVVGSYACTDPSVMKPVTSYVVCASQTWTVGTCYDCGVQPIGSKGTNFCTPLVAGATTAASCAITGIYPYYYGKLTGNTRPAVTNSLVTIGCIGKAVCASTSTVCVSFNSSDIQYTWLAIPSASASRVKWWISDLDCGFVSRGNVSDKYPDECQICITSAEGCWSDICYKIYMSGGKGEITASMQFRLT